MEDNKSTTGILYSCIGILVFSITVTADELTCPKTGQYFYQHPTTCTKFIECNNGQYKEVDCIQGLQFNPTNGWCDFPENAKCDLEVVQDNGNVEDDDEYEEGSDLDGSGDEDDAELDEGSGEDSGDDEETESQENDYNGVCPSIGQYFYPHPYACAQFIECNDGVEKVIDCIEGLHFNPATDYCDFPENVDCTDSTPAPFTTEASTTTEIVGGPVGECPPENGEYVDFLTHSTDCTLYYMCNWGTPILMECPADLHFNPIKHVCDWASDAGCIVGQ